MFNKTMSGFAIKREKELSELGAVLYHMVHEKTGLELVWLKRDEENMTFGIAFETLPWDDTGVFHILEHSVLCGSEKYPVKEPFVELMKSSMNTFLNAMTFPDKTFYPISSRNKKDFMNLMRVYLDAVFCPLIYKKPEIFYQEGWHYELDEKGEASYKGVVFNEMKGAFASADRKAGTMLERALFPDSPYSKVSGGDPVAIPELSYEEFIDSHRRFYAPSNAYVYLDGDLEIEKVLEVLNEEYLKNYEKTERMAPPVIQKAVNNTIESTYELNETESLENKTRLTIGKVIGTFEEREKLVAAGIIAEVLAGSNQAPIPKILLSENLAEEVTMQISDGVMQPWLILDIKNLKDGNLEKIENLINEKLSAIIAEGLDKNELQAVMANVEFKLRERDYGRYPQGLIFGFAVLESWLYGGLPEANLEIGDLFIKLKEKMEKGYFEELTKELLLTNPHSGKVILKPSHTEGSERRAKEQAKLKEVSEKWTSKEKEEIKNIQENLISWQNSIDTTEALSTIPQLTLNDIPKEPEVIPTEESDYKGIKLLKHPLQTGGIAYINLYFDADALTEEELSNLSFISTLLCNTDTENYSANEVINKTRLLCGDLGVRPANFVVGGDKDEVTNKLAVSFSSLENNLFDALKLVIEILTKSKLSDNMTRDLLKQTKMQLFQKAVMAGHSLALSRISAQFSPAGVIDEYISGVEYYNFLKNNDENWDFEKLNASLLSSLKKVINSENLVISFTGIENETAEKIADILKEELPSFDMGEKAAIKPWGKKNEGIVIPADISFAVKGSFIGDFGEKMSGKLSLASQIVSLGYLWNVIRVQGGAYGTGMLASASGLNVCYSYRDPSGAKSIEAYDSSAEFLKNFASSTDDYTGFIIGTIANASPLMMSKLKAQTADRYYFSKTSYEDRCLNRKEIITADKEALMKASEIIEKTMKNGGICIVGGAEQIKKCDLIENLITL